MYEKLEGKKVTVCLTIRTFLLMKWRQFSIKIRKFILLTIQPSALRLRTRNTTHSKMRQNFNSCIILQKLAFLSLHKFIHYYSIK